MNISFIKLISSWLIFSNALKIHFCAVQKRNLSPTVFPTKFKIAARKESVSNEISNHDRITRAASNQNKQNGIKEDLIRLSGDFYLPANYTRIHSPNHDDFDKPLEVILEIHDLDIIEVNDIDYTMTLKTFLGVRWEDKRIVHRGKSDKNAQIPLDLILTKRLWSPDIDIYYLKEVIDFEVLKKDLAGMWLYNGTSLFYSQALMVTVFCRMRFDNYPLDDQVCKFRVGSYSHNINRMVFKTVVDNYIIGDVVLDYEVNIHPLQEEDSSFFWAATGNNFSVAGMEVHLHRHKLTYIIQYYISSGLFVIVSWVSFLIPPDVIPGRMTLLVTLFLVLISIFNLVSTKSPKVEGFNALTAWIVSCIMFVFGALCGYAGILFKKHEIWRLQIQQTKIRQQPRTNNLLRIRYNQTNDSPKQTRSIDEKLFVVFPIMFLIFNVVYWASFI